MVDISRRKFLCGVAAAAIFPEVVVKALPTWRVRPLVFADFTDIEVKFYNFRMTMDSETHGAVTGRWYSSAKHCMLLSQQVSRATGFPSHLLIEEIPLADS